MTDQIGSGTAQGAIEYLDSLVAKGRSRQGVVSPLKTALTMVLQKTEGTSWQKTDVTSLNISDAISRFKNLTIGHYSDGSYRTYELRILKAVEWYKTFLSNPGWSPQQSVRSSTIQKKRHVTSEDGASSQQNDTPRMTQEKNADDVQIDETPKSQGNQDTTKSDMIAYPFPMSSGEIARLYIPKSVARTDIKRLTVFLEALVIEEERNE
jgi:hypothetical protein